ncbi:hypothetical protein K493DRAFT_56427 [Basidiobolus meristosporus CBS 931.73]|uniref:VASt domain-containing protein n=1 Tax=Basidiobolus meristosporus CBS 931.73 TaxID=1314790 RepID=A0A1Y1Z230_9FUNG|nr:hypothetical protein K493DRAFT_56427 [Basidiobolus meristosporus CBS 931.73]|eukprot:ORY04348.1 hypothetical protein K493DRAFT_56427 [Basidiobolus meristosporus CBS 931.73]
MEKRLIYSPPHTPVKTNTKECTRSNSGTSQTQTEPPESPRTPKIPNTLSKNSLPPSAPIPIHITSKNYSIPSDLSVPQSLLTLVSLNSPTKDLFSSFLNAAAGAASTLNLISTAKQANTPTKLLPSSVNPNTFEEPQKNSPPYISRINQPAMATSATDLSVASPVTAGSPTSTLEHLEQLNNNPPDNQEHHSDLDDSSSDFDITLCRSKSAPNRRNIGRSSSLLRRARPRSNTFNIKEDAHDSEGSSKTTANRKKNTDFHQLFKDIPPSAVLIEDYTCAIQKDILVHGRMYITEDFICFYANIFGFVTNIVIKFKEVVSIERRNMAFFVPNAILISTLQSKYLFGSFLAREAAFNCLVYLWRKNHPALVENLAYCDSETNLESPYSVGPRADSGSDSDGYNSDELSEEGSFDSNPAEQSTGSDNSVAHPSQLNSTAPQTLSRDSNATLRNDVPPSLNNAKATVCGCNSNHFKNLLIDTVIPAPLNRVYDILYGEGSQGMKEFLIENKNKDVEVTPWVEGKRTLIYTMPINVPFGPKQTKCTVIEEIDHKDFNKYTSVVATISTPDVPNGTYFNPQTRTCFMHAGNGKTRMVITAAITWHKTSWFKSQIERSTHDGSVIVAKDTENFIVRHVVDNSSDTVASEKPAPKSSKKAKKQVRIKSRRNTEPTIEPVAPPPAETSALKQFLNKLNLTSSTTLVALVLIVLCVSNAIGWYQIRNLSQQIQSTETRLTKLVANNAVNGVNAVSAVPESQQQVGSQEHDPEHSHRLGAQLRQMEELLKTINQNILPKPSN